MLDLEIDKSVEKELRRLEKSRKTEDIELLTEILKNLELLKFYGTNLKEPYSKIIQGYKHKNIHLRELRIKAGIQYRIFYFIKDNKLCVLLYPTEKKSMKL